MASWCDTTHLYVVRWCVFFFFQAEDGIRDLTVTGVQTCALPICIAGSFLVAELSARQLGFSEIFAVVAIPGVIAMAALIIKQYSSPEPQGGAAPAAPLH